MRQGLIIVGTYQISVGRSKCYDPHHEWKVEHRYMARNMVFGIQI